MLDARGGPVWLCPRGVGAYLHLQLQAIWSGLAGQGGIAYREVGRSSH